MAKETQNLDLKFDVVNNGIQFLRQNSEYGLFYIRLKNQIPVASLLVTIQNQNQWWIQSVYVVPQERRKGNFTKLFQYVINEARNKQVLSVKLYVQNDNIKARNTYQKFGMFVNGEKYFCYDLVYGNTSQFKLESNDLKVKQTSKDKQIQGNLTNILGHKNNGSNNCLECIDKDGNKIGFCSYFQEFSEWRFGLSLYIDTLYAEEGKVKDICLALMSYLKIKSPIKVGAFRFIFTQTFKSICNALKNTGGVIEHYDVMAINL